MGRTTEDSLLLPVLSFLFSALLHPSPLKVHPCRDMKAIQIQATGGPEVLQIAELPIPEPGPGEGVDPC